MDVYYRNDSMKSAERLLEKTVLGGWSGLFAGLSRTGRVGFGTYKVA
jgi:hypothetical protein